MKHNNDGFTLVEVVAAIAILGMFFAAACSSLVLGLRLNAKSDVMLQEQLTVSTAVETLMAEGISTDKEHSEYYDLVERVVNNEVVPYVYDVVFTDETPVTAEAVKQTMEVVDENEESGVKTVTLPYYQVTVSYNNITVTTYIREEVAEE